MPFSMWQNPQSATIFVEKGFPFTVSTLDASRIECSMRKRSDVEWVSASEIGSYIYCSRQFWLQKVQKIPLTGEGAERLRAGTEGHHSHGVTYDRQRQFRAAAYLLTTAALLGGLFLWWLG